MKWLFRILLVLNVVYCVVALVTRAFPGWRMFELVEPIDLQLDDRNGRPIDLHNYLPSDAYITSMRQIPDLISFVCEKNRDRGPFVLKEKVRQITWQINLRDCNASR